MMCSLSLEENNTFGVLFLSFSLTSRLQYDLYLQKLVNSPTMLCISARPTTRHLLNGFATTTVLKASTQTLSKIMGPLCTRCKDGRPLSINSPTLHQKERLRDITKDKSNIIPQPVLLNNNTHTHTHYGLLIPWKVTKRMNVFANMYEWDPQAKLSFILVNWPH